MRLHFLILATLLFSAVAFAVGGGGGGGSGGGSGSSSASGSSGCSGICELTCLSSGAIQFKSTTTDMKIAARKLPDGIAFNVTGWWSGTVFTSDEALFTEAGSYDVNGQSMICPGLSFSCKLANITIESCSQSGQGIEAVYYASDTKLDDIRVSFKDASGTVVFYETLARSGGLNVSFLNETNRTKIIAAYRNPLQQIEIADKRCTGRYLVADALACTGEKQEQKQFRCADLLSMFDRVKCRLSLTPAEQESELELLYLPEQCFPLTGAEQAKCVQSYQELRQCQIFDNSDERVNCARQTIGLKGRFDEHCKNATDKNDCKEAFKEKTYQLIIFRFYELEEKAEEWLAEGKIDLQTAADFITLIEAAKIKFSEVQSYEEKRNVILGVRDIWKELIKVVR